MARGAIVVDIRPQAQRGDRGNAARRARRSNATSSSGVCDPTSSAHLALAADHDVEWIIVCSEGYTSSLAAAALQQLGLHKATDLVGGYKAIEGGGFCWARSSPRSTACGSLATVSAH